MLLFIFYLWGSTFSAQSLPNELVDSTIVTFNQLINIRVQPEEDSDRLVVEFILEEPAAIGFEIFDFAGNQVKQVLQQSFRAGINSTFFSINELKKGNYVMLVRTHEKLIKTMGFQINA